MRKPSAATIVASVALFLSLAGTAQAVTLVTPQGQPVGGQWQRWANAVRVPTYRGTVTLNLSPSAATICFGASGCTAAQDGNAPPEITLATNAQAFRGSDTPRETLLYELGHVFDFEYLTNADRRAFLRLWGMRRSVSSWWAGEAHPSFAVPGERFSEYYLDCAESAHPALPAFCALVRQMRSQRPTR